MYSRIFEVSDKPIPEDERYSFQMLPDWFYGTIADYADEIADEMREHDISWFAGSFGGKCAYDGDRISFAPETKDLYFRRAYSEFLEKASMLPAFSFDAFCGKDGYRALDMTIYELNNAFNDKLGFYVYDRDCDDLKTLDNWLRIANLSKSYYIGGIIDYHF